jgi:S1-C subfamily serine protease
MRARTWLVVLLGVVTGIAVGRWWQDGGGPGAVPQAWAQEEPPPAAEEGLTAEERRDIQVFRRATASVVYITTMARQRDFFSLDVYEVPQGTGTGFAWDRQGHVVTNFHVVQNGSRFSVSLSDRTVVPASLVGVAPDKDLAVLRLKVPPERLVPLDLGVSRTLQVGQRALAVGNPFGLDHSLSVGVISALGRELKSPGGRTIRDVIQTDAAINPGNSGGPLLDSSGRLIGVNSAIYSPSGAFAGIGFAVPVDTVRRLVPQLIKHGKPVQPGLGITMVPDGYVRRMGLQGVLVYEVMRGTPAARVGLEGLSRTRAGEVVLGDRIVALDDTPIRTTEDLMDACERAGVGAEVRLQVVRGEARREVRVALVALE